jgi:hypothetical protein
MFESPIADLKVREILAKLKNGERDFTDEEWLDLIKVCGSQYFKYIENPSEEFKLKALKQNNVCYKYINDPSIELQLDFVKQDGKNISIIEDPSEIVQIEAVKNLNYDPCRNEGHIVDKYITSTKAKELFEKIKKDRDNAIAQRYFEKKQKDDARKELTSKAYSEAQAKEYKETSFDKFRKLRRSELNFTYDEFTDYFYNKNNYNSYKTMLLPIFEKLADKLAYIKSNQDDEKELKESVRLMKDIKLEMKKLGFPFKKAL